MEECSHYLCIVRTAAYSVGRIIDHHAQSMCDGVRVRMLREDFSSAHILHAAVRRHAYCCCYCRQHRVSVWLFSSTGGGYRRLCAVEQNSGRKQTG